MNTHTNTRINLASYTVARRSEILTNLNSGLNAIGGAWDESKLGPIEAARYRAAVRLDAARERLAGLKAGKTGWAW